MPEITYGDGKPKAAYTWDYYGACDPANMTYTSTYKTFTLGIFQWLPKKSGGVKKGKVMEREKGYTENPTLAYEHARNLCGAYNKGWRNPDNSYSKTTG